MIKFGIETETMHLWFQNKRLDALGFIDKAVECGYDGIVFNVIEKKNQTDGLATLGFDTEENLSVIRDKLREHNLYVELDTRGTGYDHLCHILDVAEFLGAERVRTFIIGTQSAYNYGSLGGKFNIEDLRSGIEDLKKIAPELKRRRIFLGVENHELETAQELRQIIEEIGSPWIGILYDPGNFMNAWQDPVEAAKIAAPYIFGTHMKDNVVCLDRGEHVITGAVPGSGNIDLESVVRVLLEQTSIQRMNIEICYPYTSVFQRPAGTGGCSEHTGTFAVEEPPLPVEEVNPKDYYLYDGKLLDELLEKQFDNMRFSLAYFKELCQKVSATLA